MIAAALIIETLTSSSAALTTLWASWRTLLLASAALTAAWTLLTSKILLTLLRTRSLLSTAALRARSLLALRTRSLLAALRARALANPLVLADPLPSVDITAMSEAFVELTVHAWAEAGDVGAVKADLMLAGRLIADGAQEHLPSLPQPREAPAKTPAKRRRATLRDRLKAPD